MPRHPGPPGGPGPQGPTASRGQDQDQGGLGAEVDQGGLQRSAPGPLPLDVATARRRDGRAGAGRCRQHGDGAEGSEKNDIEPWIVATWCVPPKADAEYVWRMEDVIQTYLLPYDPRYPVVCFDEACKQLFGEVCPPQEAQPGQPARVDYEYERKGVCHQLLLCEPLRGWRHVWVSEHRTRRDYA